MIPRPSVSVRPRRSSWIRLVLAAIASCAAAWPALAPAQNIFPPPSALDSQSQGQGQGQNSTQSSSALAATPIPITTTAAPSAATIAQPLQANAIQSYNRYQTLLAGQDDRSRNAALPAAPPSEFENYVTAVLGRKLPRFGANLLLPGANDFAPPSTTTVPPDYQLNAGDTLLLNLSGSVETTLALTIDNDGRIFIPQVGSVSVAGVRYGQLPALLKQAVGRQFRDFRLSVSLPSLHGIRVYVTGFAANPGAYSLSSLATLMNAVLAAGGPAGGGSFRSLEVRRGAQQVAKFDLYDLLLNGDMSKDIVLQNDDVIYIPPVGRQVAVSGSVNAEAIYEALPGETIADVLRDAGGLATLADPSRVVVSELSNLDKSGWRQLDMASAASQPVTGGDILRVLSAADLAEPTERQNVLVKIEGEVQRPGRYFLAPGATVADLMEQAGALTSRAFVYGAELDRISVQAQQQRSFDDAIQQLQVSLAAAPLTANVSNASDPGLRSAQLDAARNVVDQLRQRKPDGRIVLQLAPDATALPADITLENNDRIYVPPRPVTVGVFGAVFRQGSFRITTGRRIKDYIDLAGGPQRIADEGEIFVVRASGEVLSRRRGNLSAPALPGDVIFVPVKTHSRSILNAITNITTPLFQLGLSAAAIAALNN